MRSRNVFCILVAFIGVLVTGTVLAEDVIQEQGTDNSLPRLKRSSDQSPPSTPVCSGELRGRDGRDGILGRDGRDGQPGPTGLPGSPGLKGEGQVGTAGRDGRDGQPGPSGAPGSPGLEGSSGTQGAKGDSCENGTISRDGQPGPTGPPGLKGSGGPQGAKGDRGLAGPSGSGSSGATYVRWGRPDCNNGSVMLYKGFASGTKYNVNGGTSDTLCLPETPQYLSHDTSGTNTASLYGMEFEIFGSNTPLNHLSEHNMPCALCYIETRSTVFTIPARYTCPDGFTREYYGYIMTEWNKSDRHRKDTICVDANTTPIPGFEANTNPSVVYLMEANCNGLPCPPYTPSKALTCAVCSK